MTSAIQAMPPFWLRCGPYLIVKNQSPSDMWNVLRRYHDELAGWCRDAVQFLLLSDAPSTLLVAEESQRPPPPVRSHIPYP